ncbi:Fur-regulated basic protein FbpA [Bacillus sp. V5-8f]|uniref:Fur-regulated basic protein FbpA n=1 Tax=Bacillus sp. V5-8f TaxID=2053044 RepID=UPI000C758CBE|nr:Fur-regulated basic protein FbpA [Bacillus sp. V5-8f]PLT34495.1 Fur-regulated basic protein FbpA [Bacillus sp. V5-8f]
MSTQLRTAITELKQYYIDKLVHAGVFKQSDRQIYSFTLTELEGLCRKIQQ